MNTAQQLLDRHLEALNANNIIGKDGNIYKAAINAIEEALGTDVDDTNDIAKWEEECQQYLQEDSDQSADAFSLEEFAEMHNLDTYKALVFVCNLEDRDIMDELMEGDYSNFDHSDRSQFNDAYRDLISDLM